MLFYPKTTDEVEHGFATLVKASDRCQNVIAWESASYYRYPQEINGSEIQTALIQYAGRFCERYASDLICTLADLQPFLASSLPVKNDRWVIGVGLRDSGVDHNAFLLARLRNSRAGYNKALLPQISYRKILVLDIQDFVTEDGTEAKRTIRLKDITSDLTYLDPADEENKP